MKSSIDPEPVYGLGRPIRAEKQGPRPERREVRPGIFEVDGKLQTDLPTVGPQFPPNPWQTLIDAMKKAHEDGYPLEFWGTW